VIRKTAPDDGAFWTMWEFVAIQDTDGMVSEIQGMGFDISKQTQTEAALRESEERYRIVSELVSDYAYAYRVDADGQLTLEWITDAFFQITGQSPDDPNAVKLYRLYHPDDVEHVRQDMKRILQGEEVTSEYRIFAKSGDLHWVRTYRRPIWDEQARRVVRFYGVVQEITAEKQAEQIRLEQERLKANLKKEQQFNAAIQKAVSALVHDVRTPLTVIATAKDLLDRYYDRLDEATRREKLDSIGRQLHYMVELLDDVVITMKGSFDTNDFKPELVNLAALCQASIDEIQETLGSKHHLLFVVDKQITTVLVDETLVSRILLNLLSNAIKFSPQESDIRLELSRCEGCILLRVIDQGIGISEVDQLHIFEPFYRAEVAQHVEGTGLGLNIVKDSVERHHGHITVTSKVGQGTTFTVKLPLIPG
jgi:PAS domain S-box-containing protein